MLKIKYSNQFKKDYNLIKKRGYNLDKLKEVVEILTNEQKLPSKYLEHNLKGDYKRF